MQAEDISNCFLDGWKTGAALLGVRVKPTLKEIDGDMSVKSTVPRENLWEAQTPQVLFYSSTLLLFCSCGQKQKGGLKLQF